MVQWESLAGTPFKSHNALKKRFLSETGWGNSRTKYLNTEPPFELPGA